MNSKAVACHACLFLTFHCSRTILQLLKCDIIHARLLIICHSLPLFWPAKASVIFHNLSFKVYDVLVLLLLLRCNFRPILRLLFVKNASRSLVISIFVAQIAQAIKIQSIQSNIKEVQKGMEETYDQIYLSLVDLWNQIECDSINPQENPMSLNFKSIQTKTKISQTQSN